MKDWEQNTGFCFIPDAKFPGDFWFGLRFLMKSCSLMPWCFGRCFPGAVSWCKGSKNPEFGVFNSCSSLGGDTCVRPHSASPGAVTAVWSHRDTNSTQHCPFTLGVLFNGPKSSWLCSLRSFVHGQVAKGRVSLFRYYPFLLPLSYNCVGFMQNRPAPIVWMRM